MDMWATEHSWDMWSLGELRRAGFTCLEVWCLGVAPLTNGRLCMNRHRLMLDTLLEEHGPAKTLLMLARRVRCRECGRRGGFIQPEPPGRPGSGIASLGRLRLARGRSTGSDG